GYHGIDAAIVVNIADSHAAGHPGLVKNSTGVPRNVGEIAAHIAEEQHRLAVVKGGIIQLNSVEIMSLGDEKIFPAIIVIVEEAHPPAGMLHGGAREASTEAGIRKRGIAIV